MDHTISSLIELMVLNNIIHIIILFHPKLLQIIVYFIFVLKLSISSSLVPHLLEVFIVAVKPSTQVRELCDDHAISSFHLNKDLKLFLLHDSTPNGVFFFNYMKLHIKYPKLKLLLVPI